MKSKRAPLVDVAAIKRQVLADEAAERERNAERYLRGIEIAVLGAMLTRYDFELFADVEEADFRWMQHKLVFREIRELEALGKHVDGEFLLSDIAELLERRDALLEHNARDKITDAFLQELVEPPPHVVPARDRVSIAKAIAALKAAAICHTEHPLSAVDVVECIARLRRRD